MPYLHSELLDDPQHFERIESFEGVDSYNRPLLLPPVVLARMTNGILLDNKLAGIRPGADPLGGEAVAASGVQGLCYFDTPSLESLVAAVDAKIYSWSGSAWVENSGYTPTGGARVEMAQGIDKLYLADGTQNLHSWDGTNFVDLGNTAGTTTSDAPVGASLLEWHDYRLFAVRAAEPDTIYVSDYLDVGAGSWDHTNNKFRVGGGEGEAIVGLQSMEQGWLAVIKSNSLWMVYTGNVSNVGTPVTAAAFIIDHLTSGIGGVGPRAHCKFGNDLMILTQDGVRSLRRMAGAAGQFEIGTPMSQPLENYIDQINWASADTACAVKYREYAFFAVPLAGATSPDHVFVWNGRLGVWMGIWTGWNPRDLVVTRFGNDLRLVFGDGDGHAQEWKDQESRDVDGTFTDNGGEYEFRGRTKTFNFSEPISLKDLWMIEARFENSRAEATLTIYTDNADTKQIVSATAGTQNELPVDLPFDLYSPMPVAVIETLDDVPLCDEVYVEFSGQGGNLEIKNLTLAAFLNTIENE